MIGFVQVIQTSIIVKLCSWSKIIAGQVIVGVAVVVLGDILAAESDTIGHCGEEQLTRKNPVISCWVKVTSLDPINMEKSLHSVRFLQKT